MTRPEITDAAMSLPAEERADLASKLLQSLDALGEELSPQEWKRVWAAELTRRREAVIDGSEPTFAADDVFDELETELRGRRRAH